MEKEEFVKRALDYNRNGKVRVKIPGKIETQDDLSLAYTPGVAEACKVIAKNPGAVFEYTAKHNTVAVVTDGSAVLGLGDIGPAASIPVMEGKCALFKRFADVDAWPVPLQDVRGDDGKTDVNSFLTVAKAISIQYGGINLEDIAAPACFDIEDALKSDLEIPVFHDDQHGTAIVTLAAILNYNKITKKDIKEIRIVILGAGAAGISIARLLKETGAKEILMCDSKGVIHSGRSDINKWKQEFAIDTDARTPEDAFKRADVFIGVSRPGIVTKDMVASMNDNPAIFPMSNPLPEIAPEDVTDVRSDAIIATGRSDSANQINNILIFPFVFRAALDVRAKEINKEMMIAAAAALAELARDEVPQEVLGSYSLVRLEFGRDYIIPKPFDRRVFERVSLAVAATAMETGVARKKIDLDEYQAKLAAWKLG